MKEYHLLMHYASLAEAKGLPALNMEFAVDESDVSDINSQYKQRYILSDLYSAVDICYANSWLTSAGSYQNKYSFIRFTHDGFYVGKSKLAQEQHKSSRTPFKKFSDYIIDHKGFFVFITFVVGVITVSLRLTE